MGPVWNIENVVKVLTNPYEMKHWGIEYSRDSLDLCSYCFPVLTKKLHDENFAKKIQLKHYEAIIKKAVGAGVLSNRNCMGERKYNLSPNKVYFIYFWVKSLTGFLPRTGEMDTLTQ